MSNYHEPAEELSNEARDFSRALNTLKEEIEAVDWYHQRVDCTENESLKEIMTHNRNEEIEHACMTIEWLRRNMSGWDVQLRTYLFKDGDILQQEDDSEGETSKDLNIGKL